ncbi:t-SNARE [Piedraia hortae CBS 480.64]|uniref:t-SNARE n=1 Tax=Piedraia hortae CBS 480.64 TaxID=1314780 RepID=A0A6A7BP44_9PEZI|nr:t-SNARE [Piedraia hortae CBS 480.64]
MAQNYGSNPYATGQQVEMQPVADANKILNDCRSVSQAIDQQEARLPELEKLQRGFVSGNGTSNAEIENLSADIMAGFRELAHRVRRIKSQPEADNPRNSSQVAALDRRIRQAIQAFQSSEAQFRREVNEQQRRQYLIVRPDATETELQQATEGGGNTQIFQQALLHADRRGQAQSTLRNVQQRHEAIQQIEQTMNELTLLFQQLDEMIVMQEPKIQQAEQQATAAKDNVESGNKEMDKGIKSARGARKKKWICLGICFLIIAIIVIIVCAYGATQGWFSHNKSTTGTSTTTSA